MEPSHNLDEAVRHLIRHFNKLSHDIEFKENRSRLKRHHPVHLDCTGIKAFSLLEGHVTLHFLGLLQNAWMEACSTQSVIEDCLEFPCTKCPLVLQYYLPCKHYLRPFAILQEPIPLCLVHPRWHIDQYSWDPSGSWKIPIDSLVAVPAVANSSTDLTSQIPDHRGQQPFVKAAYGIEDYLARQPAHIAAQRAREFEQTAATLQ